MSSPVLQQAHRFAAIAVLTVAALAIPAAAHAQAAERTLYVSVLDGSNAPVTTLEAADFIVQEDGRQREVLRVSRATEPIDVALLVDNSAAADDAVRYIRDAARRFAARLQPKNAMAVVGLADRPTILAEYTNAPQAVNRGIDRVFAQSGSGMLLLDAIVEVVRGLRTRAPARAAIVAVLTEGTEFSTLHYTNVLDALRDGGASFHAIVIGTGEVPVDDPSRNRAQVLDEGTRMTGGLRQIVLTPLGIGSALDTVATILDNQYKVVYARPQSLIPPKTVTVAVRRPGLTAHGTAAREVRR